MVKEQLAFYNALGISEINHPIESLRMTKESLTNSSRLKRYDPSWNYAEDNEKPYTHSIHPYPAMMIPQIAGRLITQYARPHAIILDPFCGSGSVLLEAFIRSYYSYGIDINPLSHLISKVKTTPINPLVLHEELEKILKRIRAIKRVEIPHFPNIDYWFKSNVIEKLARLKKAIEDIKNKDCKDFFNVVFSVTVRTCSNTRNDEFKLYRLEEKKLKDFNPNVFEIFKERALHNINCMAELWNKFGESKTTVTSPPEVKILNEDTRYKTSIPDKTIDLVVTSPPYGDSKTTVAYGQFSRLSLQWLGFNGNAINIDNRSLGGRLDIYNLHLGYSSSYLRNALKLIAEIDQKRARDVMAFYIDLHKCFQELGRVTKRGGFLCMVVGNRTVKGVQLPTDEIVADFGELVGFKHIETIIRKIPNKRMPLKNSPTNQAGIVGSTMTEEYIVIMEKTKGWDRS
ncbi:MAG: DNA methyltransferase [Thermodesulfovibrionales bacterium]